MAKTTVFFLLRSGRPGNLAYAGKPKIRFVDCIWCYPNVMTLLSLAGDFVVFKDMPQKALDLSIGLAAPFQVSSSAISLP